MKRNVTILIILLSCNFLISQDSLKISKQDLILLSSLSVDNKEIITKKFPKLFREAEDLTKLKSTNTFMWAIPTGLTTFIIERCQSGIFINKGFRLNDRWDWVLERDEYKQLILIPYKR